MPSAECAECFKDKEGLKEYGYISFDMGDRNRQAEMYLHCSDRGLGGWSWWLDQD